MVATDVAARGIHINNLDLVINFDIPDDPQNYIHRIGRTGRAGKDGEALMFVCEKYNKNLKGVEKSLGYKIPVIKENYKDIMSDDMSENESTTKLARDAKKARSSAPRSSGSGGRSSNSRSPRKRRPPNKANKSNFKLKKKESNSSYQAKS